MDGGERKRGTEERVEMENGEEKKRRTVFHGQNNEKKLENCDAT